MRMMRYCCGNRVTCPAAVILGCSAIVKQCPSWQVRPRRTDRGRRTWGSLVNPANLRDDLFGLTVGVCLKFLPQQPGQPPVQHQRLGTAPLRRQ